MMVEVSLTMGGHALFVSRLTLKSYQEFTSSYQSYQSYSPHDLKSQAFVFVDDESIRLLTNLVNGDEFHRENIFAVSVAQDGWMELLALPPS